MKLSTLEISNFRGFRSCKFEGLADVTVFCGRNNCGKTTALEAIYSLLKGAQGNSIVNLNSARKLTVSWEDLAMSFFGGNADSALSVRGRFENEYERIVSIRILDRSAQSYTGNAEKDANLAKRLEVREQNFQVIDGTRKNLKEFVSGFLYMLKVDPPYPGGLSEDSWMNVNPKPQDVNVVYLTASAQRDVCLSYLKEVIDQKRSGALLEALQETDGRIRGLTVNGSVKADVEGVDRLLPVQLLGDGMQKLINVLSAIYHCRGGGCVCIDEIDNGLHYSVYRILMRTAVAFAREHKVQLMITTHNIEFLNALTDDEMLDSLFECQDCFALFNLFRASPENQIRQLRYDWLSFKDALDRGLEVR